MTTYSMTPVDNDTRIRSDHNTASAILGYVNADVVLVGYELFKATAELKNAAGGVYQKIGDEWVKGNYIDKTGKAVTGWVARIHVGLTICDNFKIIPDAPPPPVEPPAPVFPESFILTDPQGNKAEYKFVRIVES